MKNELLGQLPQGIKLVKDFDRFGILIIEIRGSEGFFNLIEQIERNPSVEYAEPNIIHSVAQTIPNEYASLSVLQANQWALASINAPLAWVQTVGSDSVLISIIDTGIAIPDRTPRAIYRWHHPKFNDYLYTTDPAGESGSR